MYSPRDWPAVLAADLYIPRSEGLRPAVLVVHGGGWKGGQRGDMDRIAERLAERGFVVMNASYRLAPAHRFPAQLQDLQQALGWLRAAAPRYGVDPRRVGGFGYSAGAHLVALLGTIDTPGSRLQALVTGGLPSDLRRYPDGKLVIQLLGATFEENPALFAAASPIVHVSAGDPPMFLYHGALDKTVDPSHSVEMKRALDRAGVRAELRTVPLLGHLLTFVLARGTESEAMDFLEEVLSFAARGS